MRAAQTGDGDAIKPLIAEIRSRMQELVARELALRERERELERQFRSMQNQVRAAAPNEWLESQERLRQRSTELDAQALELSARSARLQEFEQRLLDRQSTLEQAQRELTEHAEHLRRRNEASLKLRAGDHDNLRQRIARIRQREQDIENRIRLAHGEIVQQRQDVHQQREQLEARVQAFEQTEQGLRARKTALECELAGFEQGAAALNERAAALAAQQRQVQAQHAEVARSRGELAQIERALDQRQQELEERARQVEGQVASSAAQRADFARELDEICVQRTALIKQQAEHEQRLRRLADYEEQLRARAATLETETSCLAEAEAQIEAHRKELETQTQRALKEAELQREQALALREQAEARDAEVRQGQLAAELELQELAAQRAALERSHVELDELRQREEGQLEQARAALGEQAATLHAAQRSWLVRPGRWWLRTGVLGVLGGIAAALAWLWIERPIYEAAAELHLAPGAEPQWAFAHEQRLRAPDLMDGSLGDGELSQEWQKLSRAGLVRIEAEPQSSAIRVTSQGLQPGVLARLVEAAVGQYAAQSGTGIESADAAEAIARLNAEHAALDLQAREIQQKHTTRQNTLAALATEEQRAQARAASDRLRADYDARGKALIAAQSRLSDMENAPVPRGNVLPVDYENTLLADEMYQADVKEFRAAVVDYRSELAVALLLFSDLLKNVQGTIGDVAGVVAEQRGLQPPPPVEAVLEQFESDFEAFLNRLAEFTAEWNTNAAGVQDLDPELPLADLIARQVSAAEKARQFCGDTTRFENGLRERLAQFTSGSDGGTREVVVVAVLRSELAKLSAGNAELNKAADNADATRNIRLDALERQLRGLQSRLERRQASVRQLLQFEADERARREQVEQVSALRQQVQELQQARERLIRDFGAGIDELRRLEDEVVQRTILTAEAQRAAADLESCQARMRQIDQEIAAAQQAGMLPPVQASAVRVTTISGEHRERNAAFAGLAVVGLICTISLLSVVRNPLRRRREWDAPLEPEPVVGTR